ncbi:hypothetical protein Tco_0537305 [Tanacetum coccineum]
MSSPNHSTSDIEDAFSSMNILNYTSVSSDYFPASSGSISFNSSENSNIIPSVISPFYNNPCLKDVQAFYAKESPISPPDPITPPAILTPSLNPPNRTSTILKTRAITLAAIRQLINDGISSALKAQAASMCQVSGLQQDRSPDQVLQKQQGHKKAYLEISLLLFLRISKQETTLEIYKSSSENLLSI